MLKVGRYGIALRRKVVWMQTQRPTTCRQFLFFWWLFKEARPTDVDKEPEFPIDTLMEHEGRQYRYWGPAPKDIVIGQAKEGISMRKITFKAGDIFATKVRGPIAWLHERLFIPRTDRFHFGFIAGRTRDGDYEIRESIDKGIALGRLFQHYAGQDVEVYRVADPHFQGLMAVQSLSKVGRSRYDYVLVARLALNIVKLIFTGKLPPWTANQLDYARDRRFVCTEAVAYGCREAGRPLAPIGVAPLPCVFKQAELDGKIRRIYGGKLLFTGTLGKEG